MTRNGPRRVQEQDTQASLQIRVNDERGSLAHFISMDDQIETRDEIPTPIH